MSWHPGNRFLPAALFACGSMLWSQNLVRNPSFEQFRQCPDRLGNLHADVPFWSSPTLGSTDYFNACSEAMGIPENFNGSQAADFGGGYAGIYLYAPNDYREYIQGELAGALQADAVYEVSFYVSLADRSDFAIREFGLVLSEKKIDRHIRKELSKTQLYRERDNSYTFVEFETPDFYIDTANWVPLQASFTASGKERYLTIGNFRNNAGTRTYKTSRNAKQGAYYYLDMIRLSREGTTARPPESYALGRTTLFRNVLFGFNDFALTPEAEEELMALSKYLAAHAGLHITINGHTDNVGSDVFNKTLAGYRCKAVAEYLQRQGVPGNRIRWVAYGYEQPVADNSTEEGRRQNRRVTFSLRQATGE